MYLFAEETGVDGDLIIHFASIVTNNSKPLLSLYLSILLSIHLSNYLSLSLSLSRTHCLISLLKEEVSKNYSGEDSPTLSFSLINYVRTYFAVENSSVELKEKSTD